MASQRLNLLILACLFCASFVVLSTGEDLKKSDILQKPSSPKKVITEKKSDPKIVKTQKGAVANLAALNQTDSTLPPSATTDRSEPVIEDDDLWDKPLWNFQNNSIYNESTIERVVDDKIDDQRYFFTQTITDPKRAMNLWVDLDSLPKHQTFTHEVLSDSHRRAASITLPFKFPFYGQNVSRATIATGGFLYMGEHVHSWLAATQYIAPLMANFDTRNSTDSAVMYGYNASLFVIEWRNVKLQEMSNAEFTFQCILFTSGDIAFVYKKVPVAISSIPDSGHPVKIGVSDAYFINRAHVYVRRKTIYEYHKLDMINTTSSFINNQTAIYLKAKQTCITLKTCGECLTQKIGFDCAWCPAAGRCSDGYDRQRQEWISKHCDQHNIVAEGECPAVTAPVLPPASSPSSTTTEHPAFTTPSLGSSTVSPALVSTESAESKNNNNIDLHDKNMTQQLEYNTHERRISDKLPSKKAQGGSGGGGVALSLIFLLSIVAGIGLWTLYAYRNPTSASGQLLIRWRPSAWKWNSAETRYTAASIHM